MVLPVDVEIEVKYGQEIVTKYWSYPGSAMSLRPGLKISAREVWTGMKSTPLPRETR